MRYLVSLLYLHPKIPCTHALSLIPKQGDPFFLRQPEEIWEAYYLKEYQTDGARIAVCSTNPNFDENILDMTDIYKREMIVELKD